MYRIVPFCLRHAMVVVALMLFSPGVFAYICDKDAIGPLSVTIEKIEKVTQLNNVREVKVVFKNDSDADIAVTIAAESIEQVSVTPKDKTLTVAAQGEAETSVQFECAAGTYNAHYPVHVFAKFEWEGAKHMLHPVQVFETDFGAAGIAKKPVGQSQDGNPVFTGEMVADAAQLPLLVVPNAGGIALTETDAYRVTWQYDGLQASGFRLQEEASNANPEARSPKPEVLSIGWQGNDERSRTNFVKMQMTRGGVNRKSFMIHPPYQGGPGTMFTEYLVQLPDTGGIQANTPGNTGGIQANTPGNTVPITFSSHLAIRDIVAPEPESDGVTFAVWVGDTKVGEKHTASKTWVPFEVDLSQYAGQTVLLRLQSDPGPRRDTTCDSAFWGTPLLRVGEAPKILTAEEKAALFEENLLALQTGRSDLKRTVVFELAGGIRAAVTKGNYAFIDGIIGFGTGSILFDNVQYVQYDGLRVEIDGQPLGTELSALGYVPCPELIYSIRRQGEMNFMPHLVVSNGKKLIMTYNVKLMNDGRRLFAPKDPALQFTVDCDDPLAITKVEFGPATHHANRVYFGHGYCITEPERFEVGNGGHSLSTSHVGFDFDNGLSVLMATTTPPERFVVDPASKTYTLTVCPGTTMTLLPGTSGAMDCAIRYRPLYDKQPSAGVAQKAGRFVFDVWGGRYGDHLKKIQEQIDYGVTDALFVNHNWQRWGYDNRLPDIWPPNPRYGTLEEMQELLELCKQHGILYGLHDNYIDIYPDATDYNFDAVSFHENGQPRKAWNNYGIEAQSYQLRPDRLMPFLQRNFDLMTPEFQQTAYFVDVFASMNLHEFWDRDGNKHGRAEMLSHWNDAFDYIRERLGNNYPTISEAGSDFLIGHLDGADCQFLTLSSEPGDFKITLRCKHWARVPWFDAVNHTRFSLHGVGYDSRYAAHRGFDLHGYMSDDYMSAEVLTGHALQVGWNNIGRDSIRKYWLLQPLVRNLANAEIERFSLLKGQGSNETDVLFQPVIDWSNGTSIIVALPGPVTYPGIPPYDFVAYNPNNTIHTSIRSLPFFEGPGGRQVVEFSDAIVGDERWVYFNPRQVGTNALPIMPVAKSFERIGDDKFNLVVDWNVFRSLVASSELRVASGEGQLATNSSQLATSNSQLNYFLHLEPPQMVWYERPQLTVIGGGTPETPVAEWESNQTQDFGTITVPDDLAGGTYNVLIGLWNPNGTGRAAGQRAKLLGPSPDNSRILLGKLKLEKRNGKVTKLEFTPETEDSPELFARLLPAKREVLDAIVAPGAMRSEQVLPIPLRATGGVQLRYPKDAAQRDSGDSVALTVIPLPEEPATTVVINVNGTSNSLVPNVKYAQCDSLIAVDRTGTKLRDVPFTLENDELRFDTAAGEFAYKAVVKR